MTRKCHRCAEAFEGPAGLMVPFLIADEKTRTPALGLRADYREKDGVESDSSRLLSDEGVLARVTPR